ncbi:TnpV protein [Hominenteromicrobium sp.]|uniref:TnpV protein n=1 Tax=Hominenteromicrobium sp. TaxID=3073581 RepID=UPI003A8D44D7
MEKYITDERTGLKYELVGDYYLIAGDDEPEEDQPIGTWGQRHLRYLKEHHRVRYANLLTIGKLNDYLADLNEQAEELFLRLVKQTADAEGITEKLKASDQMEWVRQMNSIRNRAMEIVNAELIFA